MSLNIGRISETKPLRQVKEMERRFLYALVEDGRASLTQIARKAHLSKDAAHYLLTNLQKKGILTHIAPIVDLQKFGYQTYHAFFVTNDEQKERKATFLDYLALHPHTKAVMEYTSRWEVEWTLVAENMQQFDQLLTQLTTKFPEVILEKSKLAIIKGYKSTTVAARYVPPPKKARLYLPDKQDQAILQQLHEDGRRSSYAMAQKVHLSANAVRYRIKKMVQADIIRFFTATVNLNALGYHLYTVGFILKSLSSSQEAKLKEFLNQERFIIRAVKVLGSWDVLITILADDLKHFHETVKKIVDTFSDIIISYEALIAYEERVYKYIPSVVLQ